VPEIIGIDGINRKDQNHQNGIKGLILKRVGETRPKISHLENIDKLHSKSRGSCIHVGSTPTSGTIYFQ
jgi:hypothetical protein